MGLTKEQIDALLAKKAARTRGGGRKKNEPNVDDRTYQTWFKMIHKLIDDDTGEMLNCSNEHCVDPRDRTNGQTCINIKGQWVCRYCFMDGWLIENPAQQAIV
jgi:hypothetical protein